MNLPTININGNQYCKVSTRVNAYHNKDYGKVGGIETTCKEFSGKILFRAEVAHDGLIYTGHAFGSVNSAKALEKLETIAVGRALAFAGFLADGEIATYEEMENVEMAATADQINYITSLVETSSYTQEMRDSLDTEIFEMSYQKASEVITDLKNNQLDAVTQRGNPSKTESRDKVKDSL